MKKAFGTLILALGLAAPVFCLSLEELLDAARIPALKAGEKQEEIQFGDSRVLLAPRHEDIRLMIEEIRVSLEPGITAEALSLYAKPALSNEARWAGGEQLALLNQILSLSSLAGLQYYSASREAWRTFYESSSVIDGPSTKKPLADPVYSYLPGTVSLYARQKDLTFGDNTYHYEYRMFPDALVFVQQNLTSLTAGIIPAVGKNKLRSVAAIIDAGDYLVIYVVSMARAAALPGLKNRIGASFANRAEAVITWFEGRADRVYKR